MAQQGFIYKMMIRSKCLVLFYFYLLSLVSVSVDADKQNKDSEILVEIPKNPKELDPSIVYKIKGYCEMYYETSSSECGEAVCGQNTQDHTYALFVNKCILNGYICLTSKLYEKTGKENCGKKAPYFDRDFWMPLTVLYQEEPLKP